MVYIFRTGINSTFTWAMPNKLISVLPILKFQKAHVKKVEFILVLKIPFEFKEDLSEVRAPQIFFTSYISHNLFTSEPNLDFQWFHDATRISAEPGHFRAFVWLVSIVVLVLLRYFTKSLCIVH